MLVRDQPGGRRSASTLAWAGAGRRRRSRGRPAAGCRVPDRPM